MTLRDPKFYLFFTATANGRKAAKDFIYRLKERDKDSKPYILDGLSMMKKISADFGDFWRYTLGTLTQSLLPDFLSLSSIHVPVSFYTQLSDDLFILYLFCKGCYENVGWRWNFYELE